MKNIKTKINSFHQKVIKKERPVSLKKKLRDMERLIEKLKENNVEID